MLAARDSPTGEKSSHVEHKPGGSVLIRNLAKQVR